MKIDLTKLIHDADNWPIYRRDAMYIRPEVAEAERDEIVTALRVRRITVHEDFHHMDDTGRIFLHPESHPDELPTGDDCFARRSNYKCLGHDLADTEKMLKFIGGG
jgi:hypothetical protein